MFLKPILLLFASLALVNSQSETSTEPSSIPTTERIAPGEDEVEKTGAEVPIRRKTDEPIMCTGSKSLGSQDVCPAESLCKDLDREACTICHCSLGCNLGETANATCFLPRDSCQGGNDVVIQKEFKCHFCFQADPEDYFCDESYTCDSVAAPPQYYLANCTVRPNLICLGKREFQMKRRCNWTGGYKWTTAMALSITLGGFGADR